MPLNEFILNQILKHSFENKGRNNVIAIEIKNDSDQQDCLTYLVDNGYLKPVTTNNKISGNRLAYIVTDKTIEIYESNLLPSFIIEEIGDAKVKNKAIKRMFSFVGKSAFKKFIEWVVAMLLKVISVYAIIQFTETFTKNSYTKQMHFVLLQIQSSLL